MWKDDGCQSAELFQRFDPKHLVRVYSALTWGGAQGTENGAAVQQL